MTEDNLKEAIKAFLYVPINIGVEHNIICDCGNKMKLIMSGSSFSSGDSGFECKKCGKKLFLVWNFVKEFPHPYDKAEMVITKFKDLKEKNNES